MKTVIFNTENAAFKFDKKEVRDYLIGKKTKYAPDGVSQLLKLISTDIDETILISDDHYYFGFVAIDLIGKGMGAVTCNSCEKIYTAGQLKEIAIGHGISPFSINQKQKGGIRVFEKRKNPSMFGGQGFECSEGHTLISMETWKT